MILWGFLPWSASALAGRYHVVLSRGGQWPTCGEVRWWGTQGGSRGTSGFRGRGYFGYEQNLPLALWSNTNYYILFMPLKSSPESIPDLTHTILKVVLPLGDLHQLTRWRGGHITKEVFPNMSYVLIPGKLFLSLSSATYSRISRAHSLGRMFTR